jgi:16S rRNA (guanine527-N7)-methyltransferase
LNLTTISAVEEVVERHYCEALFLGSFLGREACRIIDIGSGAGFPGLPVAILRPECPVTLVEAHQRKAVFLKEASREHRNLRVLARRAEEVSEEFDVAISRAVSYKDLKGSLRRLAGQAMLLTGVDAPTSDLGLSWGSPIPLPWGKSRFLRISSGTDVSRETGRS